MRTGSAAKITFEENFRPVYLFSPGAYRGIGRLVVAVDVSEVRGSYPADFRAGKITSYESAVRQIFCGRDFASLESAIDKTLVDIHCASCERHHVKHGVLQRADLCREEIAAVVVNAPDAPYQSPIRFRTRGVSVVVGWLTEIQRSLGDQSSSTSYSAQGLNGQTNSGVQMVGLALFVNKVRYEVHRFDRERRIGRIGYSLKRYETGCDMRPFARVREQLRAFLKAEGKIVLIGRGDLSGQFLDLNSLQLSLLCGNQASPHDRTESNQRHPKRGEAAHYLDTLKHLQISCRGIYPREEKRADRRCSNCQRNCGRLPAIGGFPKLVAITLSHRRLPPRRHVARNPSSWRGQHEQRPGWHPH